MEQQSRQNHKFVNKSVVNFKALILYSETNYKEGLNVGIEEKHLSLEFTWYEVLGEVLPAPNSSARTSLIKCAAGGFVATSYLRRPCVPFVHKDLIGTLAPCITGRKAALKSTKRGEELP